jgi:hypothetical protein
MDEVADFVQFLRLRYAVLDTAQLSEAALAEGWLAPEEDETWKTLMAGDVVVVPFPFTTLEPAK